MNTNLEPFELLLCEVTAIIYEADNDYIVSIAVEDVEYGVPLIGYDGTLLTFADTGCADQAHIQTIHQTYLRFKKDCGFELDRIIIEAKYGDVFYCRLHWNHSIKQKNIFNVVSIGDAIILHTLSECELYITRFALNQMEKFDSEGFSGNFED